MMQITPFFFLLICFPAQATPSNSAFVFPSLEFQESASEQAFWQMNNAWESDPAKRDYDKVLAEIESLVRAYPGTDAADMALSTVGLFAQGGFIDKDRADAYIERLLPFARAGVNELNEVMGRWEVAKEVNDQPALRDIAEELSALAGKYPDTYCGYVSSAHAAESYYLLGEGERALQSYRDFVNQYPLTGSEFTTGANISANALSNLISLTARHVGVNQALDMYDQVAETSGLHFALTDIALYSGGKLAYEKNLYDRAISFVEKYLERHPEEYAFHLSLAEILYLSGDIEAAILKYEQIANELDGDTRASALKKLRDIAMVIPDPEDRDETFTRIEAALNPAARGLFAQMRAEDEKRNAPLHGMQADDVTKDEGQAAAATITASAYPDQATTPPVMPPANVTRTRPMPWLAMSAVAIATVVVVMLMLRSRLFGQKA